MAGSRAQRQDKKSLNVLRCLKSYVFKFYQLRIFNMSHIPVSIILRGRCPTGAVCITSSWGAKIDRFISTAVLHTFHSLKGVDWFIGPSWHLPTSLGRWGGHHVFAVCSGTPLICMSRCWIGDLESQGNFGFFVWSSEKLVWNFETTFYLPGTELTWGTCGPYQKNPAGSCSGMLIILTPLGSIAAVCFMPTSTWNSNCVSSCSFPLQSHFPRRMWLLWRLQHFQPSRWSGKGQGNKSSAHGSWLTFQATSKALFYTAGRKSGLLLSLTSTSLFANPGFFQDGSTNSAVLCRPQFKVTWFW